MNGQVEKSRVAPTPAVSAGIVILTGPEFPSGRAKRIKALLPLGFDSSHPPWRALRRSKSLAPAVRQIHTAISTLEIGSNPAETGYVNRNVDPRFTEAYNTMIYKEINHKKD
jgi:hypothetical protein